MWKRSHTHHPPSSVPGRVEVNGRERRITPGPCHRSNTFLPRSRRTIAVGAIAALVLGLTAACGDDDDPTKSADQESLGEGESLTITTFGEFGYDELIEEWNAENPDVQVEQTKVSLWDDWKNELNTLLQAGSGSPTSSRSRATSCPRSSPHPTVGSTCRRTRSRAAGWSSSRTPRRPTDGALLGYATDAGPEAICYRADLFEDAGLPSDRAEVAALMTTWEDYFALGEQFVAELRRLLVRRERVGRPGDAQPGRVPLRGGGQHRQPRQRGPGHGLRDRVPATPRALAAGPPVERRLDGQLQRRQARHGPCPGWMRSNIRDNTGDPAPKGVVWDIADVFPGGGGNWGGSYLSIPKTSTHQDRGARVHHLDHRSGAAGPDLRAVPATSRRRSRPSPTRSSLDATDPYFNEAPAGEIFSNRAARDHRAALPRSALLRHPRKVPGRDQPGRPGHRPGRVVGHLHPGGRVAPVIPG